MRTKMFSATVAAAIGTIVLLTAPVFAGNGPNGNVGNQMGHIIIPKGLITPGYAVGQVFFNRSGGPSPLR
jgi:hypothetical protein